MMTCPSATSIKRRALNADLDQHDANRYMLNAASAAARLPSP